jgi:hypothetical protein
VLHELRGAAELHGQNVAHETLRKAVNARHSEGMVMIGGAGDGGGGSELELVREQ